MTLRSFSYGGGVQSNAAMVLMARGDIEPCPLVFANVGEDAESWQTLTYMWDFAAPYAAAHGLGLLEVQKRGRDGTASPSLLGSIVNYGGDRTKEPIPIRGQNGKPLSRSCTSDWKIKAVGKLLKAWGATEASPAHVLLGISTDEVERSHPGIDPIAPYQYREYPLLDLNISRAECHRIIASAGLPDPPKSSCTFCPFHKTEAWRSLQRDDPGRFDEACNLENLLNARRDRLGMERVWLTRAGRPLRDVFADEQLTMDLSVGDCEGGWCMT